MSTDAVRNFVAQLRQAQLLEPGQQQEAERLGQTATRPAELAGELVRRGWMTPYQANQVARGRGAELVLGSYLVLEPLARGGMGQVFKARHRYLQRLVALKFIRPEQRDSQDTVQRFQREVRLLADLRHPHIVQAHDAGNVGDAWFLAMELLEGVNLDQLVQKGGPLPIGQACLNLWQAALGLQHAHERGLVHRDIKPSNLFLTAEGIKLLDLGLARTRALGEANQPGDLTRANTVMGTPDYLAPEQALDPRRADARSDLYSLGCTLFFLLTGRPPFPEGTLAQKLLYHQQATAPSVQALRADVPPAAAELLRRLLAKAPQQRPASAAEVAASLAPLAAPAAAAAPTDVFAVPPTQSGPAGSAAAPASLIDAKAAAPQRGFTLMANSLAPTAAPSLVEPAGPAYERGWTLPAESLPPAVHASAAPSGVATAPVSAPLPSRRRLHWTWLAGAGGLGLVLAVALLWLLSGGRPAADAPRPAPKGDKGGEVLQAKEPPSVLFPKGPRRFLSELPEFDVMNGEWPIKKGDTGNGQPIRVGGVLSPHGLGMHPPVALWMSPPGGKGYAAVKYGLGKEAELFKATVAINDTTNWCWSPATFTVLGDGKELWKSVEIAHNHKRSQECQVVIKGVDVLELRVQVPNGNKGVEAVWFEPHVLRKFDSPDPPGGEANPAAEKPPVPAAKGEGLKLAQRPPEGVPGLVAFWPLDEGRGKTARDKSHSGISARVHGGEWVPGVKGSGLRLNGTGDYVDLGGDPRLNFASGAPFTVAGWVATQADQGMICSFRRTAGFAVINLAVRKGRLHGWVRDDTSGFGGAQVSGGLVKDGQWHHVALLRHPDGAVELLLDATPQGRAIGKSSGGAVTTDLRALGSERFLVSTGKQGPTYFAGRMDEFCVFNRALAVQEIASLAGAKKQ
jgi:serine/threonine-protein kinase